MSPMKSTNGSRNYLVHLVNNTLPCLVNPLPNHEVMVLPFFSASQPTQLKEGHY